MLTTKNHDRRNGLWLLAVALMATLAIGLCTPMAAQQAVTHETTAVPSATAVPLQAATTSNVSFCLVSVEGGPIRYWTDGTQPSAASGYYMNPGASFPLISNAVAVGFRAIAINASATLQTQCYLSSGGPTPTVTPSASGSASAPNTGMPNSVVVVAGVDANGVARPLSTDGSGILALPPKSLLLPCNALRRTNCQ